MKRREKAETFNPYGWDLFKVDNKHFTERIISFIDENTKINKQEEHKEEQKEKDAAINNLKYIFNMK